MASHLSYSDTVADTSWPSNSTSPLVIVAVGQLHLLYLVLPNESKNSLKLPLRIVSFHYAKIDHTETSRAAVFVVGNIEKIEHRLWKCIGSNNTI